jgi:N-acetylglucosamine kinase-like BadF-type ATPase
MLIAGGGTAREVRAINEQIVIGVDGGGTRLRAAIATTGGELLGAGEAGSGNYHDVGADVVQSNIDLAVSRAWAAASMPPQPVDAIFLGLGSIVTREDQETIRAIVRDLSIAPDNFIGVDHDLRVALMGGLTGRAGIVLIAGTGSSCYGRDGQDRSWQAGGWGPLLDDPGSGYWLGRQAMIAAVRDHDGRGEATRLRGRVLEALGISDVRRILQRVELHGMKRSEIAALAHLVTESAADGDSVASAIIERGVEELAMMVAVVAVKLDFVGTMQRIPVAVTGGLTNARRVFLDPLAKAIRRRVPQADIMEPLLPPVLGAALLAIELAKAPIGPKTVGRLVEGYTSGRQVCAAK